MEYDNFIMRGYMRKQVEETILNSFAWDKFPKRYFVLNFHLATLKIAKHPLLIGSEGEYCQSIPFREIHHVTTHFQKKDSHPKYPYGFGVQTTNRLYKLHTKTVKEREIWMDAFKYAVESKSLVQVLLEKNQPAIEMKLKRGNSRKKH